MGLEQLLCLLLLRQLLSLRNVLFTVYVKICKVSKSDVIIFEGMLVLSSVNIMNTWKHSEAFRKWIWTHLITCLLEKKRFSCSRGFPDRRDHFSPFCARVFTEILHDTIWYGC